MPFAAAIRLFAASAARTLRRLGSSESRGRGGAWTLTRRPNDDGRGGPEPDGGGPIALQISSTALFSASLPSLPPMPRKPPSLCALATACATVITNFL